MNNRKPIFFTSDLHLFHENSIKFDNRPFTDIEHMHRHLIRQYNAVVPVNGVCYFVGDIGLGGDIKSIISQLNGTKVLILGNHDKAMNAMYNAGFDVVMYGATLYIAGQKVTMTHCPLLGVKREDTSEYTGKNHNSNWHGEHKQLQFTCKNEGQFHLHGHIHSPNNGKSVRELSRQYDVGVVANKYRPVSISQIESWITRTLKEEKCLS